MKKIKRTLAVILALVVMMSCTVIARAAEATGYTYYDTLGEVTNPLYYIEGTSTTNAATRHTGDGAQKLFSSGGADYYFSGVCRGTQSNNADKGGTTGYDKSNKGIYIKSYGYNITAVNMDLGDRNYVGFSGFTAQVLTGTGADIGQELRFMVSSDEKSYYTIGFGRDNVPFAKKVENGTAKNIRVDNGGVSEYATSVTGSAPDADNAKTGGKTFTVSIEGQEITAKIQGTNGFSFTAVFTDEHLAAMVAKTRYPISLTGSGDHSRTWKNIGISYTEMNMPAEWNTIYAEDFEDVVATSAGTNSAGNPITNPYVSYGWDNGDLTLLNTDGTNNTDWHAGGWKRENYSYVRMRTVNSNKFLHRQVSGCWTNPTLLHSTAVEYPEEYTLSVDMGRHHGGDGTGFFTRVAKVGNSWIEAGIISGTNSINCLGYLKTISGVTGFLYDGWDITVDDADLKIKYSDTYAVLTDDQIAALTEEEKTTQLEGRLSIKKNNAIKDKYRNRTYFMVVKDNVCEKFIIGNVPSEDQMKSSTGNMKSKIHLDTIIKDGKAEFMMKANGTGIMSGYCDVPWAAKGSMVYYGAGAFGDGGISIDNIVVTAPFVSYKKAENGVPTVNVEPLAKPDGTDAFVFAAGYYTGDKMDKVVVKEYAADATAADTFTLDAASGGQELKLMVWDSLTSADSVLSKAITVK